MSTKCSKPSPGLPGDESDLSILGTGRRPAIRLFTLSRESLNHRVSFDAAADRGRLNDQLLVAFEHAPSGIALIAHDGRYVRANPALCSMLGFTHEELLRLSWQDVIHPDDRPAGEAAIREALSAGGVDVPLRAVRSDGADVLLRVNARALRDSALFVVHYEDLTARDASQATLEAVVDAAAEAIVGVDEHDVVRIFSPSAERLFGRDAEDVVGRNGWELALPDRHEDTYGLRAELEAGKRVHRETVVPRPDGSLVDVFVSAGPILGADGEYRGAAITLLDISDVRRAEREVGSSRTLLQQLIDNAPNVIAVKDRESAYRLVNRLGSRLLGRDPDGIVGATDFDLVSAEVAERSHAEDAQVMAAGVPMTFSKDFPVAGGWRRYVTTKFPIPGPDGRPDGVGLIATDVSEVRRAAADRARLAALAAAARDAIVTKDLDGMITSWNAAAEDMFGLSADEAVGRSYADAVAIEDDDPPAADCAARPRPVRTSAMRADGSVFPAQVSTAPLVGPDGTVTGTVAILRDISELADAQREVERSHADLERFALAASHDLQEPLRSIKLGAETVLRAATERLADDERALLAHVEQAAERMSAQVSALLGVAQVALEHPDEPVSLEAPLDDSLNALRTAIGESGAVIDVHHPLPATSVPRAEMALVFQNLIGNALKFRRPGEAPCVTLKGSDRDGRVRLRVADNGIGLSRDAAARVFGMFERGSSKVPGTGVGLAVCRRILERRGGSIAVASAGPGQGSEFVLELPAARGFGARTARQPA